MSSKSQMAKMGWVGWGKVGVGFSMTNGEVRADMEPTKNPSSGLIEWRAVIWKGDDRQNVVAEVWGPCHLTCAREAALVLSGS